jgi:geranylgeranyl pyrophosphate synthase
VESRSHGELASFLEDSRRWAELALDRHVVSASAQSGEARITEVMRYALLGGGKRLRPTLVRLLCRELGGSDADAERPAAARYWTSTDLMGGESLRVPMREYACASTPMSRGSV